MMHSVPLAIADDRLPTDGALVEVTVKAADSPGGGVGIVVGYPRGGDYLAFTIGGNQTFRVLSRQDNRLTIIEHDTSSAIEDGAFNRLMVVQNDGEIAFSVNGSTLLHPQGRFVA